MKNDFISTIDFKGVGTRVVNDIGCRDMSLSKNFERHHCLRHVELWSDIFKKIDKNVDVENVEIFKRAKFKHLSTKNSFDCTGTV